MMRVEPNSRISNVTKMAQNTLRIGDMNIAVELPDGEDLNEWLAVNVIEFYNEISLLYGCLTEFCTKEHCPKMSAGPRYEYRWADGTKYTDPVEVSASEYIDFLMKWIEKELSNEELFPCKAGVPFPNNFKEQVKVIFKRLFRVYAHIYHSHFPHVSALEAEPHLNTSFKHFIYFVDEFNLIDDKDLAPLAELIQEFKKRKQKTEELML